MLKENEATELGMAINALVIQRGLGAISKKDYELLVFHHIVNSSQLNNDSNYALANKLKVTESRIKSMRLEAAIRHAPANHKAVLGKIVQKITDELSRPEFTGETVSISIENPVEKREFEHAIKSAKHIVEYGINRENLIITPIALFEIILSNVENPEQIFKEIVQSQIKLKNKQKEILDTSLTLRQKINKFGNEVTNNSGAVAILTAAATSLV